MTSPIQHLLTALLGLVLVAQAVAQDEAEREQAPVGVDTETPLPIDPPVPPPDPVDEGETVSIEPGEPVPQPPPPIRRVGRDSSVRSPTSVPGIMWVGPRGRRSASRKPGTETVEVDDTRIEMVGSVPRVSPLERPAAPQPAGGIALGPLGVTYDARTGILRTRSAVFNVRSKEVTVFETQPNGFRVRRRVSYNPYSGAFDDHGVSWDPFTGLFRDRTMNLVFDVRTGIVTVYVQVPNLTYYKAYSKNLYDEAR